MQRSIKDMWNRLLARLSTRHRIGLFSMGWTTAAQVIGLFVRLASNLILTRLLAPEMYGILGSAMAVMTTLEWLSDIGVQPALVRHPQGNRPEYLITGWWTNLGRGFLLASIAALCAWPWAEFCRQPQLFAVLLVMSVRPILHSLRSPGMPMLRRNMQYKRLFADEIVITVCGTVASIVLGVIYHSMWAIVFGTLIGTIASIFVSYYLAPIAPRFRWNQEAFREIYKLGHQVFVNTLVMALWLNLDRLVGLRFVSPEAMGLYAIAWNLSSIAEALITRWCDIHFAILSREENMPAQQRWHELVSYRVARYITPLMSLAIVIAPAVIWILYDPRYDGAGILFGILTARLMIRSVGQIQFQYLMVQTRVHLATRAYLVALIVQAALFVPMVLSMGIVGLALCMLISTTVLTLTQTALLYRRNWHGFVPALATLFWMASGLIVMWRLLIVAY